MNRREVLATLGVASAQAVLWACGPRAAAPRRPTAAGGEVRNWLRDAVARLAGAGFSAPQALAVSRQRTVAAIDVLGAGVQRGRCDGVVLTVRDRDGAYREQVTADLSADGVAAAVRALAGAAKPAAIDFGAPDITSGPDEDPSDRDLLQIAAQIGARDHALSSRIVYRAEVVELDDARVWSVSAAHDREQHLVRARQSVTRVAWNGTRPVIAEAGRAWTGKLAAHVLETNSIEDATRAALSLMTPRAFADGDYAIVLDPSVVARIVEVAVGALLTSSAARRPEVARRLALGANIAAATITLADDPTAPEAYGGFHFDDEGEPAAPIVLVDHGRVAGRLADRAGVAAGVATAAGRGRRPGHVGRVEPSASHLAVAPGSADRDALLHDGFALEGGLEAVVDPASDRVVVAVARARELRGGNDTGRVYADLELVGELASLLATVDEISTQTQTFGLRDELDAQPRWRSIEAPWLRARGRLRARRSPA